MGFFDAASQDESTSGHRYLYLLISLLVLLLVSSFFIDENASASIDFLLTAVLLAGVYSISHSKKLFIISIVLAAPILVLRWSAHLFINETATLIGLIFAVLFFVFNTGTILRDLVTTPRVTTDTILGAISAYILIGLSWGMAYMAIEFVHPGSFTTAAGVISETTYDFAQLVYYSFVCLTTLGFGDINPLYPPVRVLSYLEAVTGQIYLTVLVARFVGLHLQNSDK